MRPDRRLGHAAQAQDRRRAPENEKRESLRSSPFRCRSCREGLGDIPTPPRAMTKLFDAACGATFAGHLEKTGGAVRAHNTRFGRDPNYIVNLTLTPQTPGKTRAKPPAAWT